MTIGVVLMTYGAPADHDELPAYLARVRGGRTPPDELVTEMRRRYDLIGGSPLIAITRAQAACLEAELGAGYRVVAGMRFSEPSIDGAVHALAASGCRCILGICLSPQWSPLLMGGYEKALAEAVGARASGTPHRMVGPWHRTPALIDAFASGVRTALAGLPTATPVLFTAHSLPRRVFEAEPDYVAQLRETADLVAARAEIPYGQWLWAYQSAGHTSEEWLRPDLKELFPLLAEAGRRDVLVAPVQFLADHLEVLYDLDIAARGEAEGAGLRYHRAPMPNTDASFIHALAAVVRSSSA